MVNTSVDIVSITYNNVDLLEKFLAAAGNSLNSFRYFEKRPFSVLKDHIVTVIITNNGQPIGYGHLDKDNQTVWLGIAIAEGFKGQGLGTQLMNFLISKAAENDIGTLHLTVDSDNIQAISLYKRFDFVVIRNINERSVLMERKA